MKRIVLGVFGALVGALSGGIVGAVVWISVFYANPIYDYSTILLVFIFIPAGIVLGALIGAAGVVYLTRPDDDASGNAES